MRVALLCNVRPEEGSEDAEDDAFEEHDSPETIAHVSRAIAALGVEVEPVCADRRLPWRLEEGRFDCAFNLAEGEERPLPRSDPRQRFASCSACRAPVRILSLSR